mmetsp:Transcript_29964/g.51478  ORF Transcript_29964/g.51478 Transcript_29964/m.51478 type:complete len:142 (+) Transcript_29964:88-513(+)
MNRDLATIVGEPLPFGALAYGPIATQDDKCMLYYATANLITVPGDVETEDRGDRSGDLFPDTPAVLIELVGTRFLRRMVRILVATLVRSALLQGDCDSDGSDAATTPTLRQIALNRDRAYAAHPAPPEGLCFVGCGYADCE